jgi:hypothetical protein
MDLDIAARLREPFPAEKVGKLPKVTCGDCSNRDKNCTKHQKRTCKTCKAYVSTSHTHLDFVGHADVTDRLLTVDPGWSWAPLSINEAGLPMVDNNGGMWIKLTIAGKTMLGYGHAGAKKGGDAVKEIIGDAIRNAAMRFGVALDMWRKEAPEPVIEGQQQNAGPEPSEPANRADAQRAAIAALGKKRGWDITTTAAEFLDWSRGQDVLTASEAVLAEYIDYLQKVKE